MDNQLIYLFFCILGIAFFSGSETAMLGLNPLNVVMGDRFKLYKLYKQKEAIISTCLIAHSACIVTSTLLLANMLENPTTSLEKITNIIIDLIFFFGIFIFGEVLPKTLAKKFDFITLQYLFYPIYICYLVFFPINWVLLTFSNLLFKFLPQENILNREDIFHFLSYHLRAHDITSGLMSIGTTSAKEIMIPISQIYSLQKHSTVNDFMTLMETTSYSRYPIFDERGDNIIGYVQVTDLINANMKDLLVKYLRSGTYIPEHLPADKLLYLMQSKNTPMVFVINEFGSIIGLVTIENLAEEIVGNIDHQLQPLNKEIIHKHKNQYILLGSLDIDDFNDYFKKRIDKDGFETLAGYLMKQTDSIPQNNEIIKTNIGIFKILKADNKHIQKILFSKK